MNNTITYIKHLAQDLAAMLTERKDITGIFCHNDEIAKECYEILAKLSVSVPEQVSVIGFDNSMLAEHYQPALTTIGNPVTDMGTKSALELFRMMRKEGEPEGRQVSLQPSLIVRDTCHVKL